MHIQIARKTGVVKRVPHGEEPFVELTLEPNERIIEMPFSVIPFQRADRKTVDWRWEAIVEHRFHNVVASKEALLLAIKDALTYTDPNELRVVNERGAFGPILDALAIEDDAITHETGLTMMAALAEHGWRFSAE